MLVKIWRSLVSYFSSPLLVQIGLNLNVPSELGDGYVEVEWYDNYGSLQRGTIAMFADNKERLQKPDKTIVEDIFKQVETIGFWPTGLTIYRKKKRRSVFNRQGKLIHKS